MDRDLSFGGDRNNITFLRETVDRILFVKDCRLILFPNQLLELSLRIEQGRNYRLY